MDPCTTGYRGGLDQHGPLHHGSRPASAGQFPPFTRLLFAPENDPSAPNDKGRIPSWNVALCEGGDSNPQGVTR